MKGKEKHLTLNIQHSTSSVVPNSIALKVERWMLSVECFLF